jgi:hypothetical protein
VSFARRSREARKLKAARLVVTELTEKTDNAIKFISHMFYARTRMAAGRVELPKKGPERSVH